MKKISHFILPIFAFSSIFGSIAISSELPNTEHEIKRDNANLSKTNPNNHPYIDYNSGDIHNGMGGAFNININEKSDTTQLEVESFNVFVTMKEGIDWNRLYQEVDYIYFTLYDVTNGKLNAVEIIKRENRKQMDMGAFSGYENQVMMGFTQDNKFHFETSLKDYHKYKVGYNINKGDDLQFYSDYFELSAPILNHFEISTTENQMTFEWNLTTSSSFIRFNFLKSMQKLMAKNILWEMKLLERQQLAI